MSMIKMNITISKPAVCPRSFLRSGPHTQHKGHGLSDCSSPYPLVHFRNMDCLQQALECTGAISTKSSKPTDRISKISPGPLPTFLYRPFWPGPPHCQSEALHNLEEPAFSFLFPPFPPQCTPIFLPISQTSSQLAPFSSFTPASNEVPTWNICINCVIGAFNSVSIR